MKHHPIAAAALCASLVCGLSLNAANAAPEEQHGSLPGGSGLSAGDTAFVDTAVATLWVSPGENRPMDAPSLSHPVDLDAWNRNMEGTEDRGWLTGHLETQALYGSEVTVTEVSGAWAHVVVQGQETPRDPRGYPGWVPVRQLVKNPVFDRDKDHKKRAVVTRKKTRLTGTPSGNHPGLELSFNTELPVLTQNPHGAKVELPDGTTAWLPAEAIDVYAPGQKPAAPTGEDVVRTARQFTGLRYLWAGMSAYGFDCSGFTYNVYRAHGIDIPRDAGDQAEHGTDVAPEDLQPGDLLFFAQPGGTGSVHHVGMYIGHGAMIHAPNESTTVSVTDWRAWDSKSEFSGAKRML